MRFVLPVLAAAIAGTMMFAATADAQTAKRKGIHRSGNTVLISRDEDGRRRTRIVVEKRSFLDPGTEVLPGSQGYTNYAFGPGYGRPFSVLDNTAFSHRSPLWGPFDLAGRNNFGQW